MSQERRRLTRARGEPASILLAAFVTIFHDLQYHAIVWHYQQNRIHRPGVDQSRFGLAALAWSLGCLVEVEAGCMHIVPPLVHSDSLPLFGRFTWQHVFFGMALGMIMHHYFVDQFIWRPSKDAQLRKDLKLE